jgi:uncharacterized membrane protein YeiH
MNFFLKSSTPLIFFVLILPMIVNAMIPMENMSSFLVILFGAIEMIVLLTWFYAIGSAFYNKLRDKGKLNFRIFQISAITPILALLVGGLIRDSLKNNPSVILIISLLALFAIFYCINFAAKVIAIFERNQSVGFADYADNFFLLWFFPIGVWFIQPKIQKLLK